LAWDSDGPQPRKKAEPYLARPSQGMQLVPTEPQFQKLDGAYPECSQGPGRSEHKCALNNRTSKKLQIILKAYLQI
jgi:hypothetical protein